MSTERVTAAYARPGDLLRFECADCADLYRQTVQPRRNVARALTRLDEGNVERAKELLTAALLDLQGVAEWMNERGRDA